MALTVGDRPIRPLTADEVMRMVEAGILGEDEPVELLRGVLVEMSAKSPAHEAVKMRLNAWLGSRASAGGFDVRIEAPIVVPDRTSLPEPDVSVVAAGGDPLRHPTTALLVVEVAVSSLAVDTRVKPPLLAAAGVPELWVVDVAARRIRRYTDPGADGYATEEVCGPDARLQPRRVDVPALDLGELFAGL